MSAAPYAIDPFGPSANPGAYVACEASERARAALEGVLDAGRIAALVGPPGHGKTLLLRLLAGREQERARVAYVPFSRLEADELYALALSVLGVAARSAPREELLGVCAKLARRGGVVMMIDDAGGLSDACAASLAALYREARGQLRLALAAVEGPEANRVLRAFGEDVDVVYLHDGMSEREARRYVETRLAYGGARPELVAAFDEETIEELHRTSQGVPRRLNQAAEDVVRRASRFPLPRLREIAGLVEPPPTAETPRAEPPVEPPASEAPSHLSVVPDPQPSAQAPESEARATPEVEVPAPPEPPAPEPEVAEPAESAERPEAGGILLHEAFDEGAGEYRLVRGKFVDPDDGQPVAPEPPFDVEEPFEIEQPAEESDVHDIRWLRRRSDEAPEIAAEVEPSARPAKPSRELPVRALGLLGFALGIAGSFYWMSLAPEALPGPRLDPAPPAVAPAPTPTPGEAAPRDVAPAPQPAAAADPIAASDPATSTVPAPLPIPSPAPSPSAGTAPGAGPVAVSINATPWAVIEVDGRELGETPLAGIRLAPGVHVFRARMPDGSVREQAVEIGPDHDTVVFQ